MLSVFHGAEFRTQSVAAYLVVHADQVGRDGGQLGILVNRKAFPQIVCIVYVLVLNIAPYYTRLTLGGRTPLCGIGVVSFIDWIVILFAFRDRMADSRPEPTPFTKTSTLFNPMAFTFSATSRTMRLAA
jgi:hypothetical protein